MRDRVLGDVTRSLGEPVRGRPEGFGPDRARPRALNHAARSSPATRREQGYLAAAADLYRDVEHREQSARVVAYRDTMEAVSAAYPEDMEARVFYALALAEAVPRPTRRTPIS